MLLSALLFGIILLYDLLVTPSRWFQIAGKAFAWFQILQSAWRILLLLSSADITSSRLGGYYFLGREILVLA